MTPTTKRWTRRLKPEDWVIVVPALAALVLGTIGFVVSPQGDKIDDPFFRALGLLTGSGADAIQNPWLRVGRWFGVIFVFAAAVRFLARNLGASLTVFRTRRARGHEVIIGLGRKGRTLLTLDLPRPRHVEPGNLLERLWPVDRIGLDRDVAPTEGSAFGTRSLLVPGDAATLEGLQMVSIEKARKVIIATKEDALNIAIAERITTLRSRQDGLASVELFVHVADPVLRSEAFPQKRKATPVVLRPFALPAGAARAVLRRFPVAIRARDRGAQGVNLVFVGFDDYAEAVLVQALRLGRLTDQAVPVATVFAAKATEVENRLRRRYAAAFEDRSFGLGEAIRVLPFDPTRELDASDVVPAESEDLPVTAVFVQGETDAAAYALALRTRRTALTHGAWKAPFFVRLDEPAALAGSLRYLPDLSGAGQGSGSPFLEEVLEPYGALESTLRACVYEDERPEMLAVSLHLRYQRTHQKDERPAALDEWTRLAEETRESNRRAIDHFGLKLACAGYVIRGEALYLGRPLGLTTSRAGLDLSRLEHESWSREKLLAGWRFGTPRNNARRRHDCLLPFDRLTPELQAKDKEQIEGIEELLYPMKGVEGGKEEKTVKTASIERRGMATVFRERVIAVVGETVVARDEGAGRLQEGLRSALEDMDVVGQLGPKGHELWTFVTALAPGADCILARGLAAYLGPRYPGRFRLRVLQPLPLSLLVAAWRDQGGLALGMPDGITSPENCAQEEKPGVLRRDQHGALIPDLGKVESLLRGFVNDSAHAVESFVDMSSAALAVSQWPGGVSLSNEAFRAAVEEASQRFQRYVLSRVDELIAACEVTALSENPSSPVGKLVRAWIAADRKGLHVIRRGAPR